ncbi:MAG: rhodanese-like domain-containing protein [Bacteroidales bacterium]|jgi:rhodanese-related sulfurtransferase|nr:rhodanese-like domain-containing protein [Bacteroidales bacterium]
MKTKYLTILILVFFYISARAHIQLDTRCYENINCYDFNLLNETTDVFLIDLRTHKEYRKERIPKAFSAPNKDSLRILLDGIDKTECIYVYCVIGVESKMVSKFICKELNFSNVYNLEGGISKWKKKGFLIDKSQKAKNKN